MGRYGLNLDTLNDDDDDDYDYVHDDDHDDNDNKGDLYDQQDQYAIVRAEPVVSTTNPYHNHNASFAMTYDSPPPGSFVVAYDATGQPIVVPFLQPPKKPSSSSWQQLLCWLALLGVLVAHLVQQYGPPAPPPMTTTEDNNNNEVETWDGFWQHYGTQLWVSVTTLASVVPHVAGWCWKGVWEDVTEYSHRYTMPADCALDFRVFHDDENKDPLSSVMVGQDRAVSMVRQALRQHEHNKNRGQEGRKSLFLLLSGTVGVGKRTLANAVARALTLPCLQQVKDDRVDSSPILIVDAAQQQQQESHDASKSSWPRIQQHMQRRPKGSVVVIHHVEHLDPWTLQQLCQVQQQQQQQVVVIGTTHVGAKVIHRSIKHYGGKPDTVSRLELDLTLRHELDTTLFLSFPDDPLSSLSCFPTVVPFWPLQQNDTMRLLQQRAPTWWQQQLQQEATTTTTAITASAVRLVVTASVARVWTDPQHLEYVQWMSNGVPILVVATRGGKDIEQFLRPQFLTTIQPCQTKLQQRRQEEEEGKVLELSWDQTSGEVVGNLCDEETEAEDDEMVLVCEELCRFYID